MTTLYRHFDSVGVLLYVGITDNLSKRNHEHACISRWWPDVERTTEEPFDSRVLAKAAEVAAIRDEHPLWNKMVRQSVERCVARGVSASCEHFELVDEKCRTLGITFSKYVQRLIKADLERNLVPPLNGAKP